MTDPTGEGAGGNEPEASSPRADRDPAATPAQGTPTPPTPPAPEPDAKPPESEKQPGKVVRIRRGDKRIESSRLAHELIVESVEPRSPHDPATPTPDLNADRKPGSANRRRQCQLAAGRVGQNHDLHADRVAGHALVTADGGREDCPHRHI